MFFNNLGLMQSSVVKSEKKKKKKKVEDNKRASTTSTASNMDSCDNNEDNFAAKNVKNDAPFVDINKASKEPIPENPVTPRKQKKRNSVSVSRKVKVCCILCCKIKFRMIVKKSKTLFMQRLNNGLSKALEIFV